MRPMLLVSLLVTSVPSQVVHAERWTGDGSPLDGHRLVVVRPHALKPKAKAGSAANTSAAFVKHRAAVFGEAVSLQQRVQASVSIRESGKYSLWVRIGQTAKFPNAIQVRLTGKDRVLIRQTICDSNGSEATGGPQGYAAYRKLIEKFSSKLAVADKPGGLGDDLLNELANPKDQARRKWATLNRMEDSGQKSPFYWWKLPAVDLKPGQYTLALATEGRVRGDAPLFDAGFLTTFGDLPYPYHGDIDARPASYLRFRIDALPPNSTALGIRMGSQLHHAPWGASASFAPNGINHSKPATHEKTGHTRWYRLQDIENFSGFGGATLSIALNIHPAAQGSTEFAVFPHDDFILRRFDWNEPDGKRLSMRTDFQTFPQDLRTLRDYAREHYQTALWATRDQVFPLTRAPLHFANGWGNDSGAGNDYLVKTLRLLGFNSCGAPDNAANSRRYGWQPSGGHYWPPAWLPYNEPAMAERYKQHYAKEVGRRPQSYENVGVFQIADEPGEINTTELSAPFWLHLPAANGQPARWHDPTGSSELQTKRTDFGDCVLEGVLHSSQVFAIRVGQFGGGSPKSTATPKSAFWRIGRPNMNANYNLSFGVTGGAQGTATRPGATPSNRGVPFKLIYQSGPSVTNNGKTPNGKKSNPTASAVLYCNGRLMTQLNGLPARGGFAIQAGGVKSISKLQLRSINKDEQLLASLGTPDSKKGDPLVDDLLDEISKGPCSRPKFTAKPLKAFVNEDWEWSGGLPEAHVGFRKWLQERGVTPKDVGASAWKDVRVMTIRALANTPVRARLYYWSRRYANYLTPRMFALAAEGIRANAPNRQMKGFVALSGHALYLGSTAMPLDMFELAKYPAMTPGVSDWMSMGGWRWDSHQAVAYSVAPFNAGARRYGQQPVTFPMMHCVWPSVFRAYTQVANQCKTISYWTFGPSYSATEGFWSDSPGSHRAVHTLNNRAAQVDDILGTAVMRPSRVAMLYSHATHIWSSADSYHDKRAAFLGLSHEYYQPELVTEEQIADGCLKHYDALYVLEPHVSRAVQDHVTDWTQAGGLLWTCSNAITHDEYNQPHDWLSREAAIRRSGQATERTAVMNSAKGQPKFQPHRVAFGHRYEDVTAEACIVRANYDDGSVAWIEKPLGKGRVVYVGHRAGVTYSSQSVAIGGRPVIWAQTGRDTLTRPLHEAGIARELVVSQPTVMATAQSTDAGTLIVLYNMRADSLEDLQVTLAEPKPPASVQMFDNDRLIDVPFKFAEGKLSVALNHLHAHAGQMLVVRRRPAAIDPRLDAMKSRAAAMLTSKDPLDLSAGAWLAGFHPEWQLANSIELHLDHPRWEVRRSAAEALGRLKYRSAAQRLLKTLKTETDGHARADQLHALARIDPVTFVGQAKQHATHPNMIVRHETMRAIQSLLGDADSDTTDIDTAKQLAPLHRTLVEIAKSCLADQSQPIRHAAISIIGRLQPAQILPQALAENVIPGDRTQWITALVSSETSFAEYLKRRMPGDDNFFYAVAQRRRHPELAKELERRLLADTKHPGLLSAVEYQRDPALMRRVLANRDRLSKVWQSRLVYQLETTFHYGIGRDLNAWLAKIEASDSEASGE